MAVDNEKSEVLNDAFYSNNLSIQIGGKDIFIDFHCTSPRFLIGKQDTHLVREHKMIIMNLVLFRSLINFGNDLIRDLETEFGDIDSPDFLRRMSEKQQKILKEQGEGKAHEK